MDKNDFNRVAFLYDFMARVVFGKSIINAQLAFLDRIMEGATILIIGGGTGKILETLDSYGMSLEITYVEMSSSMLKRAEARAPFRHIKVFFHHNRYEKFHEERRFDAIITFFFLDIFSEESLPLVMGKVKNQMKANGQWFLTDFVHTGRLWQRAFIRLMYRFFRLTARLEGQHLLDFHFYFKQQGLSAVLEKNFCGGMITSRVYRCLK